MKQLISLTITTLIFLSASAKELQTVKGIIKQKKYSMTIVKKNGQAFTFANGMGKKVKPYTGKTVTLKKVTLKEGSDKFIVNFKKLLESTSDEDSSENKTTEKDSKKKNKKSKKSSEKKKQKKDDAEPVEDNVEEEEPAPEVKNDTDSEEELEYELDLL